MYDFRTNQEAMNYKGEFILKMIKKFNKPVVYIDGDMRIHKYPKIFDSTNFDFMLRHWSFDPLDFIDKYSFQPMRFETSGGIMYFNTTKRSIKLLNDWIKLNRKIIANNEPGADDRILTMMIHKNSELYKCRWLPLPSTYLWLTDKFSMKQFHGKTLPKKLNVVIDHPHCLTTEEMAKNQGAVMNSSGARIPLGYYNHVKGDFLKFPFIDNPKTLSDVKDVHYRQRLMSLIPSTKNFKSVHLQDIDDERFDFFVNKNDNNTKTGNTIRGKQLIQDYFNDSGTNVKPTAKQFLKWIQSKPFSLMTTRIHIN